MKIECKFGSIDLLDSDDVENLIEKCAANGDSIWIGEQEYPCLSVLVNGEKAVVHYFTSEDGDHFQSVADDESYETTPFYNQEGIWDAPNEVVISLASAIEFIKEFMTLQKRPSCIQWDEI